MAVGTVRKNRCGFPKSFLDEQLMAGTTQTLRKDVVLANNFERDKKIRPKRVCGLYKD